MSGKCLQIRIIGISFKLIFSANKKSYEGESGLARLEIKTSNDRVFGPFGCAPTSHCWVLNRIDINANSKPAFQNGFSLNDLQFFPTPLSGRYVTLPLQRNNETDSNSDSSDSSYLSDDEW